MALSVEEGGFVRIAPVGGVDRRALAAARVTIHTAEGPLPGVVTSVPPHLQTGEPTPPKVEDLFVDTGLPAEQARKRVRPGDRMTFDGPPLRLGGDRVTGAALDDRCGCAAVILAARELLSRRPELSLCVLLASQEETGSAGAKTGAFETAPDLALAVDVSFGSTPGETGAASGRLGGGPMIGLAPILKKEVSQGLIETAKREGIPYQLEVMGGRTGTDADLIATAGGGVPAGLVSIPLRYMHTPGELVSLEDVLSTARLLAAYGACALQTKEGSV